MCVCVDFLLLFLWGPDILSRTVKLEKCELVGRFSSSQVQVLFLGVRLDSGLGLEFSLGIRLGLRLGFRIQGKQDFEWVYRCVYSWVCPSVDVVICFLYQVYEFAVKEVLIHRVPLDDGGISPQKKKRKHRQDGRQS